MRDQGLEIGKYARLMLRWWWLLLLSGAAAGLTAYYVSISSPPVYTATASIEVRSQQAPGIPSARDLASSASLAQGYRNMVRTRPVLAEVSRRLQLPPGVGFQLAEAISVGGTGNIIRISASAPQPALAALVADTTARAFMDVTLDREMAELSRFQEALALRGIQDSPDILGARTSLMGLLSMVEPPVVPSQPSNRGVTRNVMVAVAAGLAVAGLAVLVIDATDRRVKSGNELKPDDGLIRLGGVPRYRVRKGQRMETLAREHPESSIAESYRLLYANLELASRSVPNFKALMITSPLMGEGKTTMACNLAITAACSGRSVVLVDFDFRASALDRVFDLDRPKGVLQLIEGTATASDVLVPTAFGRLQVIPSGFRHESRPHPIVEPAKVSQLIKQLKSRADLVIFDTPPILAVSDPVLLASLIDGVVLVVEANRTRREAVSQAVEHLKRASPPMMGMVINKARLREQESYYIRYYGRYAKNGHVG